MTTQDLTDELAALPAAVAAARAAADPAEVMRLENRSVELHHLIRTAHTRDLADGVASAWEIALVAMRAARTAEASSAEAEAATEAARRVVLLNPGETNETRTATFAAYSAAATHAEAQRRAVEAAREEATRALIAVDEAVQVFEDHVDEPLHEVGLPLSHRRLVASVVVSEQTIGVAAEIYGADAHGARFTSLDAGTLLPRAVAYRLGDHVLGPIVADA